MIEGIACGGGNFTIGRDLSFGDGANDAAEGSVAGFVFTESIFQDSSLEILRGIETAHEQTLAEVDWLIF
jgi:hypothetical protein